MTFRVRSDQRNFRTDGQTSFTESNRNAGIRPAVNPGISVSRVVAQPDRNHEKSTCRWYSYRAGASIVNWRHVLSVASDMTMCYP